MEGEIPLLGDVIQSSIDFNGRPSIRSKSGCWNSASFNIGFEMAERFAHFGISSNLVNYLTGQLGLSTATAAANVNVWNGTASLSPILGAFIADSFLGQYRSIIAASLLYILVGLGFLSISAGLNRFESSQSTVHVIFFFFALYLVALAEGGHRPSLEAFGADQFDEEDDKERESKSSFFNWWNFCLCVGILVSLLVMSYIQDNLSWVLGFGIPCIVMLLALIVFLLGSGTYRFRIKSDETNPFVRIGRVFMKAARNWQASPAVVSQPHEGSHFRFYREETASEHGLLDMPEETVPMSVWWLAPQYIVLGVAESFTLKSMGLALC